MTGIALAIVLSAGFLHAGWNFLLKKSNRKIVFTRWFLLAALKCITFFMVIINIINLTYIFYFYILDF